MPFYDKEYKCRSFGDLYKRVILELARIDIDSPERYRACHDIRTNFIDHKKLMGIEFAYARNVVSLYRTIKRDVSESEGISFSIDDLVTSLSHGHAAKALAFSKNTYLVTSMVSAANDIEITTDSLDFHFGPNMGTAIDIAFNHRADVLAGYLTPVPDSVGLYDLDKVMARVQEADENPLFDAEQWATVPELLTVSLTGPGFGTTNDYLRLGVVLPSLEGIPLETIRKIRRDYYPDFLKFQVALRQFASEISTADDEKKLRQMFERIEAEVAALRSTLLSVRKRHAHLGAYLALSAGLIFCLGYLPEGSFVDTVRVLLGGTTGAGGLQWLNQGSPRVDSHPYYFPMLLVDAAQKQSNIRLALPR